MKKIAFCFSGQLRQFDVTVQSFRTNILEKIEDSEFYFFAHYPKDSDEHKISSLSFHASLGEIEPVLDEKNYNENHYVVDRHWNKGKNVQTYLRQVRSIYKVNELKSNFEIENKFTFDWVFRLRFDNLYTKPIENMVNWDNNTLYIPKHDNWSGYNDRFGFSSSKNMDIYAERFNHIDRYYENGLRRLHPESFLKWYIDDIGINVGRTDIEHNLLRYNNMWHAQYN